jgi:type IX secretion system PorP/SprF family membrane protein
MKMSAKIVSKINKSKTYCYLFGLMIFLSTIKMNAQQLPNYTQYLYNMQTINPAFVGYRADLSMSVLSRDQWVGIEGAPTTSTFSVNGRLERGLGIGATIISDKIGLTETRNVNFDASYTLVITDASRLSFGLKGGMTFFNNNLFDGITIDNESYASTSGIFPNVGFGALYYNQDFYVGLSVPYLLETPQFYIEDRFKQTSLATNPNVFLSTGALFRLSHSLLFKPSTMVRYTTNQPVSVDINANFLYNEVIEAGLSYRHQSSVSALFTLVITENYRIGYAYDYKTINISGNLNTHEFILHLDLDFGRSSRWLMRNKCYF